MLDSLRAAGDSASLYLLLILVLIIVLLALVIWSIKRHGDPHLQVECDLPLGELVASVAGLTHSTVVAGNAVEVFENGAFFEAMFEQIRAAEHSVHFETFL